MAIFLAGSLSAPLMAQAPSLGDATRLIEKRDFAAAIAILRSLADAGNAEAQLKLGMMHYSGQGTREDEKTGVAWMTKSANQGNPEAMYQLGNAFAFGKDTPSMTADADQDAARWYHKAAVAGHVDAQYAIGLLFSLGKGVRKDDQEALRWMQKAAGKGHKDAQSFVASQKR